MLKIVNVPPPAASAICVTIWFAAKLEENFAQSALSAHQVTTRAGCGENSDEPRRIRPFTSCCSTICIVALWCNYFDRDHNALGWCHAG